MIYIIIAHYNQSLDWIQQFIKYEKVKIIIYSKCSNPPQYIFGIPIIKRLNAGREGETYINHIIKNYKTLNKSDYTVFLQDDPIEHQPDIIKLLKFFIKIYTAGCKLPLIQPLNSHAYQDVKKDMENKDKIISGDIFSYDEYKQKKKEAKHKGKQFFNNYPPKLMNKIKTHSVYYKKEQLAQINILFLNMHLDSVLIPDSNPFIWHLYKGIANYLGTDGKSILPYLVYFYTNKNKIKEKYLKKLLETKYIPYNPSAQFIISNKLILENDLFIYENIQKVLLDPIQPILSQKVRLNGFILEFIWLWLFNYSKYYKNKYTLKHLRFYSKKDGMQKDITFYRNSYGMSKDSEIIDISEKDIKNMGKYLKYLKKVNIEKNMLIMIKENAKMRSNRDYRYYEKIKIN